MMDFPARLYELRRQCALSQEQLAEALGVSRQSISKWEGGQAMPEPEKLVILSNYFGVSVDALLKGVDETPALPPAPRQSLVPGAALVLAGVACLVMWGVLALASPQTVDTLNTSSVVTINGSGLLLVGCAVAMGLGVFLLLRKK